MPQYWTAPVAYNFFLSEDFLWSGRIASGNGAASVHRASPNAELAIDLRQWQRSSDSYAQRLEISLLVCCQLVSNCCNDWHVRQNFIIFVVFYVVRYSQYSQNFNCNVLFIYPKLELLHCICIRKTWILTLYMYTEILNFNGLYMRLVYIYAL
jgi:hypothetical protein